MSKVRFILKSPMFKYSQNLYIYALNDYNNFGENPGDWEQMFVISNVRGFYKVLEKIIPLLTNKIYLTLHNPLIDVICVGRADTTEIVKIFKKYGKLKYLA